jgi:phage tail sheath protein FI
MRKGLSTAICKPGIHAPAKVKTTGGAEQLAEALWAKIRRTIAAFLVMQWRAGALYGSSPDEAFYVKCDSETNPGESIGAGQVVCEIGVAPVKSAEFVIFRVSHRIRRHASSLRWLPRGNAESGMSLRT